MSLCRSSITEIRRKSLVSSLKTSRLHLRTPSIGTKKQPSLFELPPISYVQEMGGSSGTEREGAKSWN